MNEQAHDKFIEEALETTSVASVPEKKSWGLYTYCDVHPALGGGVGFFLWFNSYECLQDYIKFYQIYAFPGFLKYDQDLKDLNGQLQLEIALQSKSATLDLNPIPELANPIPLRHSNKTNRITRSVT